MSHGPIALVGSGEFLPQMLEVDEFLIDGRPRRAAFLPTAAGQEGDASIARWLELGRSHYASLDIEPVPVRVIDRESANRADLAALLSDVGLIFLSGGNPGYLAETLRDSLVWQAIVTAWNAGTALAGCSAGAMALSAQAPHVRGGSMVPQSGLGLVQHVAVIPHFDQMGKWDPKFKDRARAQQTPGVVTIGVDEDTALVGGPHDWTVMGRHTVTVFGPDLGEVVHARGAQIRL